jgi:hypothetical protein
MHWIQKVLFSAVANQNIDIEEAFAKIRTTLGELPILEAELRAREEGQSSTENANSSPTMAQILPQRRILPDGTYATESSLQQPDLWSPKIAGFGKSKFPLKCNRFNSFISNSSYIEWRLLLGIYLGHSFN